MLETGCKEITVAASSILNSINDIMDRSKPSEYIYGGHNVKIANEKQIQFQLNILFSLRAFILRHFFFFNGWVSIT